MSLSVSTSNNGILTFSVTTMPVTSALEGQRFFSVSVTYVLLNSSVGGNFSVEVFIGKIKISCSV